MDGVAFSTVITPFSLVIYILKYYSYNYLFT